jgi:predicted nucleic acid-binding protein
MGRRQVFVDTSAWYALQITDDTNHGKAGDIFPLLLKRSGKLVTSNHVIGETYTLLRMSRGCDAAMRFITLIRESPRLKEYFADQEMERKAYELLHQYRDHPLSFVDGLSFTIMKEEKIQSCFAFDVRFHIAGFNRIGIDTPLESLQ